jgi:chemotaxis protein MotB
VCVTALVGFLSTSCVSQGKYDRAVQEGRANVELTRAELRRTEDRLRSQSSTLEQLTAELAHRQDVISRLRSELDQLDAVASARSGDVATSRARIGELQRRLVELEAAQRASEARAALYRDLTFRLKKQVDAGDLAIVIRDGRMVLQLPNDVLFDTGRTEIKPAGKNALRAVAEVIRALPRRQFQVAGHTDNVPIHNDQFASNWELSTGRALRVVHFLIGEGADGSVLSAAGYSEVDPIANNGSPEGRKQNRRTEITLQPNIDELVRLP